MPLTALKILAIREYACGFLPCHRQNLAKNPRTNLVKTGSKYKITQSTRFAKDVKKAAKRGLDLRLLRDIATKLANGEPLPQKNRDHALSGNWLGYRECHIQPDWLLVYKIDSGKLILVLSRTGSHSDLDLD